VFALAIPASFAALATSLCQATKVSWKVEPVDAVIATPVAFNIIARASALVMLSVGLKVEFAVEASPLVAANSAALHAQEFGLVAETSE